MIIEGKKRNKKKAGKNPPFRKDLLLNYFPESSIKSPVSFLLCHTDHAIAATQTMATTEPITTLPLFGAVTLNCNTSPNTSNETMFITLIRGLIAGAGCIFKRIANGIAGNSSFVSF